METVVRVPTGLSSKGDGRRHRRLAGWVVLQIGGDRPCIGSTPSNDSISTMIDRGVRLSEVTSLTLDNLDVKEGMTNIVGR
jgi:hypothetical protein